MKPTVSSVSITWQGKPNRYEGDIAYDVIESDVGELFAAETDQGLCQLSFVLNGQRDDPLRELEKRWPNAFFYHRPLQWLSQSTSLQQLIVATSPLHICGTDFQQQVWRALLGVLPGKTSTYGSVARQLGKPRASQAVGQAVGANPLAIIIPCHRILSVDGGIGHYHWGSDLKQRLLQLEVAGISGLSC